MIARLRCWFTGHEYTTIAWGWRSKVWSQKECLRCGKRKRNHQLPAIPMPGPRVAP